MFTKPFWKDTAERVIVTAAQALLAVIGVETFIPNAIESWTAAAWIVFLAALASFLKCIIASRIGNPDNASLVGVSTDGSES
ncbi:MAG TPA: holin [Marmoricola sp.]|nr:holin [Marmoricola sp.]